MSLPLARSQHRSAPAFPGTERPHPNTSDRTTAPAASPSARDVRQEQSRKENTYAADFNDLTRAQYYDRQSHTRHLNGESRLLFAVLEDAIRCILLCRDAASSAKRRELSETIAWVNIRGDRHLFSFDLICEVFGIEPEMLRQQLNLISERSDHQPKIGSLDTPHASQLALQLAPETELCGVVSCASADLRMRPAKPWRNGLRPLS
jgi:hypothetical protein